MTLAALMIIAALVSVLPLFVNAAEEEEVLSYPISDYTPGVPCPDPIPLLCIVVNFDANGNGIDDNADGSNYNAVLSESNFLYGEQWCHFDHTVWYDMLFGENGQTLKNYYKLMSDDKFYFTPAPETYENAAKKGVANDGVVEVVINGRHLSTQSDWVYYYAQAIEQVDEYVDFAVFDKNENGKIDERELIISFINGGAELAQTPWNWNEARQYPTEAFRSRAYYRKNDGKMLYDCEEGYKVGYGGIFTTGSWSYNSSRADKATEFAVWAHELGHYLGAPDYYDTDKSASSSDPGYHFACGYYSLMAKGCHGGQPSHIDPFTMTSEKTGYGFYQATDVMEDGIYTLYSKTSGQGTYNVIKLNTPNPKEYYLIENRYVSPDYAGEAFDNYNIADKQGILIWHVDESNYSSTAANNSNDGNDPTLAVYATNTTAMKRSSFTTIKAAFGGTKDVFNPTEYKFPVSKTWYTSEGTYAEAVAEAMKDLRVEVISEPGEEMQIRVTGAYRLELTPEFALGTTGETKTSFTVKGSLKTLNHATLTSAKLVLSEKSTGTVVKEEAIKMAPDYTFEYNFEGLKPGTTYEYKVVGESSHGDFTITKEAYTKPEEVKRVTITLVVNSDHYTSITQKVNVGSYHKIRFSDTKYGYYLEGWYLDSAYTQPYEVGDEGKLIEKEGDFTIYAKWVAGTKPVETTPGNTATTGGTTAPAVTTNATTAASTTAATTAPVQNVGCGGSANMDYALIGGGAIVALIGGAAGAKSAKKQKESDPE